MMANVSAKDRINQTTNSQNIFLKWLEGLPEEEHKNCFHSKNQKLRANLFHDGSFADVVLKGADSDEAINCHRFVLAEHSQVFQRMFCSDFAEGARDSVTRIQNIPHQVLQKIIGFLYSGNIKVKSDEVLPMLEFADMYDIDELRTIVGKMLLSNFTSKVMMQLWRHLKAFNCKKLSRDIKTAVLKGFTWAAGYERVDMSTDLGFLEASVDDVIEILADRNLNIDYEHKVFEICFTWVVFDLEKRYSQMEKLLTGCIRRKFIDPEIVTETINQYGEDRLPNELKNTLYRFMLELQRPGGYNVTCLHEPRILTEEVEALVVTLTPRNPFLHDKAENFRLVYWKTHDNSIDLVTVTRHMLKSFIRHVPDTFEYDRNLQHVITEGETEPRIMRDPVLDSLYSFDAYSDKKPKLITILDEGSRGVVEASCVVFAEMNTAIVIAPDRDRDHVDISVVSTRTWETPGTTTIPLNIANVALHVYYKGHLIFFDPVANRAVFFNRKTFHYKELPLEENPLTVGSAAQVCKEGNIAVLVDKTSIDVIFLDHLLARIKTHCFVTHKDYEVFQDYGEHIPPSADVIQADDDKISAHSIDDDAAEIPSTSSTKLLKREHTGSACKTNKRQRIEHAETQELANDIQLSIEHPRLQLSIISNNESQHTSVKCTNGQNESNNEPVQPEDPDKSKGDCDVANNQDVSDSANLHTSDTNESETDKSRHAKQNKESRPVDPDDSGNKHSGNSEVDGSKIKQFKPIIKSVGGPQHDIQSAIVWGEYMYILCGKHNSQIVLDKLPLMSLIEAKSGEEFKWTAEILPTGSLPNTQFKQGFLSKVRLLNPSRFSDDGQGSNDGYGYHYNSDY